jgi:enamine deaminase RidA (YjgF/YER057c/UK114 family)
MQVEARLQARGLVLPPAPTPPPGIHFSFAWVRLRGNRAYLAGHGPQQPDGALSGPFGRVGEEVGFDEGYQAARRAALSMLGTLQRALGDLDRVTAWLMVYGMVNAVPGYSQTTNVINGFSDLILELYGPDVGAHARIAAGMAALPRNLAVTVAAEVEIAP